ncbi:MAG: cation diffusion facilitator family transporter [Robiginitomaculum sp.]|nr:cation diffusion facilitator family transporter [Robiginitomaculum sp.]
MGIRHQHDHGHNHEHSHARGTSSVEAHGHGHNHFHSQGVNAKNERRMAFAAVLIGSFMVVEFIGGILSGSLALLADAGHMLTDFAALSLAWTAFRMARRPADWKHTFGFDRFSVVVAFVNGLSLFAIAALIVWEAIKRAGQPVEVMGAPMLVVATLGLIVNIIVFFIIISGDKENLNIRAAALHVMGDLLGSVAAIGAAIIILLTGWMPADLIMSVLVAVIILRSAWYVVREAGHILMEGAPKGLDRRTISADMHEQFSQIVHVDHIHAWSISQERPMVTLEAIISGEANIEDTARAIKTRLHDRFGVEHATVEVKRERR